MPVSPNTIQHRLGEVACSHCTFGQNLAASNCSPPDSDVDYPAELRGPDIRRVNQCSMSEHSVNSWPSDMLQAGLLGILDHRATGGWCPIYLALCLSPSPAAMQPSKCSKTCVFLLQHVLRTNSFMPTWDEKQSVADHELLVDR
jgi:hypothetical protein